LTPCAARHSAGVVVVAAAEVLEDQVPAGLRLLLANFNPVLQIINLRDTLRLTEEQVTKLQLVSDSLNAKNTALADEVRKDVESAGANPDMAALNARCGHSWRRSRRTSRRRYVRRRPSSRRISGRSCHRE
jgi:hypothetical protein